MSRFYVCGFETGALLAEAPSSATATGLFTQGSVSIESSIVRSGSYSLKLNPPTLDQAYWDNDNNSHFNVMRIRYYLRVTSLPSGPRGIHGDHRVAGSALVILNPDGTLTLSQEGGSSAASVTALTDTTRWYRIEVQAPSTGPDAELYIDGILEASLSGTAGGISMLFGADDFDAGTYTAYVDDIVLETPIAMVGEGRVILMRPSSLSNANGWREGDGAGTAGLVGAVSTRPPPGVASASETSATNIESATNSASDDCDMVLPTYIESGIGPFDRINSCTTIVRHGEDINTGTKAGSIAILSNPTQSGEDTFNYGGDSGAHGAETGNWKTKLGTPQTGAVSRDSGVLLRVGKRSATTRIVCVDFMGMYVDYSEAASPDHTQKHVYPQILPQ